MREQLSIIIDKDHTVQTSCCLTESSVEDFLRFEAENGATENLLRRLKGTVRTLWEFLPEDKQITRERLLQWRERLEKTGYASATVLNYVKYINRYLDFMGCSEIRFNKGKAKDITGMTFGYLTAIAPTGRKDRGDRVWHFECKCGRSVELPATRALLGNTLSCGCLRGAHFKSVNKYYDGTSIVQSMTEKVKSDRAASGYVGVTAKRDKWLAYIKYKGVRYSLGCYGKIEDAVKARARAKELVMADAQGLLNFYIELEKTFPQRPNKRTEQPKVFPGKQWVANGTPALRSDNRSGYTGVSCKNGKWYARICFRYVRYSLGSFDTLEEAVTARKNAEALVREDPIRFAEVYSQYPKYGA